MKNRARLLTMLLLLVCAAALGPMAAAQQDDIREWESRRDALERVSEARHRPAPRGRGLINPQQNRDFRRIQVLNDELRQPTLRGDGLDLELVAKSVSEINKCAKRLKYGLALQKAEESPKITWAQVETEPVQLRSSLKVLGGLIVAFINNPAFKDSRMINAKSWVDAGRELDEIIQLTSGLKKSSSMLAVREKAVREGSKK
jgi:hypothetical protein